ncbi:MAG: DUF3870 domain-containing protein [Synergistota bacterium]|jgi:hypothetical protein|nr:DUF3870 domain-containing protein [Synergistota bacterium]OPZ40061.1 MAG: hypothetical protein BWY99_01081 [Synergistetes bacterium ADurb.BinA166]
MPGDEFYSDDTILVVGNSQTSGYNPINQQFGSFFITFILLRETGEIVDCAVSVTREITERFIRGLFIGRRMGADEARILSDVQGRYFGSSQKAIIAAYRDAAKRFREVTSQTTG